MKQCAIVITNITHTIRDYAEFQKMVQDLLNEKEIKCSSKEE